MFKVYKIVSKKPDGRLVSYNTSENGTNRDLDYAIGMTTVPKIPNSLLFAFLDLKDAIEFIEGSENSEIYLAETSKYIQGILPQLCAMSSTPLSLYQLSLFWDNFKSVEDSYKNGISDFKTNYLSSVCCTDIKLIEKVEICQKESQK